jgi:hypothetical protein
MVKKLSLKEFYENGKTKPLIALLPTKPGDARYTSEHGLAVLSWCCSRAASSVL